MLIVTESCKHTQRTRPAATYSLKYEVFPSISPADIYGDGFQGVDQTLTVSTSAFQWFWLYDEGSWSNIDQFMTAVVAAIPGFPALASVTQGFEPIAPTGLQIRQRNLFPIFNSSPSLAQAKAFCKAICGESLLVASAHMYAEYTQPIVGGITRFQNDGTVQQLISTNALGTSTTTDIAFLAKSAVSYATAASTFNSKMVALGHAPSSFSHVDGVSIQLDFPTFSAAQAAYDEAILYFGGSCLYTDASIDALVDGSDIVGYPHASQHLLRLDPEKRVKGRRRRVGSPGVFKLRGWY